MEEDHCALCNWCQKHGKLQNGVRACVPYQCYRNGSCRFHFPYPVSINPAAFLDTSIKGGQKHFVAEWNNPWMNQHSTPVLLAWRANVDLQPVLDKKAAIKYVCKYASKPEVLSQSYRDALTNFCSRMPHDLPAEKAVSRLFARMAADRDISAQEAVHLLLGDKVVGCSRTFVNLNAYIDTPHLLKETPGLDEDDSVFESAFFSRYKKRAQTKEGLSAFDFCRMFDVKNGAFFILTFHVFFVLTQLVSGGPNCFPRRQRKDVIVRMWPRQMVIPPTDDSGFEKWALCQLRLHKSFRRMDDLCSPSITDVFFSHLDGGGFPHLNKHGFHNGNSVQDNDDGSLPAVSLMNNNSERDTVLQQDDYQFLMNVVGVQSDSMFLLGNREVDITCS